MDWTERDGVSLRFEHVGQGEPTLVLVHEMGGTLESWDGVMPRLRSGMGVLRYDTRGAGLSTKIRGAVALDDMTGDIDTVLDAAGQSGPVILCGIAVGAAIALGYAARRPDKVAGVMAFAPATGIGPERRPGTLARADAAETGGMAAIAEVALAQSYPVAIREAGRFDRLRARWLGNDPDSYAAILRMLAGLDMDDALAAIRCPTLVLAGTQDLVRPPAAVEPVARQIAGARFQTIESGHFASVHRPDLLAERLNGFVQDILR